MKNSCYVIKVRPSIEGRDSAIIGVVSTFEDAEALKFILAKKLIYEDFLLSQRYKWADATDIKHFADKHYVITKENFYSKPFDIDEL